MCLNKGGKVCECYRCLKLTIQAKLYVGFSKMFFVKDVSLKKILLINKTVGIKHNFQEKK